MLPDAFSAVSGIIAHSFGGFQVLDAARLTAGQRRNLEVACARWRATPADSGRAFHRPDARRGHGPRRRPCRARREGLAIFVVPHDMEFLRIVGRARVLSFGRIIAGQQQRVAIARAPLLRQRLLVMDEPSAGLAPLIADVAERGYVMSLGRLVHEVPRVGWPALLEDERLVRDYLGG